MSIELSVPKLHVAKLVFIGKDPLDNNYNLFTCNENLTEYIGFYIKHTYSNTIIYVSNFTYISETVIKVHFGNDSDRFILTLNDEIIIILVKSNETNYDFIDKYGAVGTVYIYKQFELINTSYDRYETEICVTSSNLMIALNSNIYPLKFEHTKYINGYPSPSLDLIINNNFGYDPNNYLAIFNNVYKGNTTASAYINGFNSSYGTLELVYKGIIEFSNTSSGPWTTVLQVPDIPPRSNAIVYTRCGRVITSQFKVLDSIKIFSTERA